MVIRWRILRDKVRNHNRCTVGNSSSAIIAFVSTSIIALLTAIFAYFRYVREQEHQRSTILNALFAELANVFQHCTYASYELPVQSSDAFELEKRLRWAKHGTLRSANDISKLGFLSALNVRSLLQIELSMRNDNSYIDQLIQSGELPASERIDVVKRRLLLRADEANKLLSSLVKNRPELEAALESTKDQLPQVKFRF